MPAPTPPAALHVLAHTRDGDTLVFDPRRSRAGYVQLWSTRKQGWRRFLADRVRPHLARVTDAAARDAALAAFSGAADADAADESGDAVVPAGARAALAARAAAPRVVARRAAAADPGVDPANAAQQRALALLDGRDRAPLLLTGRAGTGKSTFLRAVVARDPRHTVVLAPTGLAALNVGGQTVHGFFRLPAHAVAAEALGPVADPARRALYAAVDTLVIDEASMLRADLLDAVDAVLRAHGREPGRPFGGARLVLFGDPFQLPPVVPEADAPWLAERGYPGPHFFDARALGVPNGRGAALRRVEFTTVYRQRDPAWVALLDAARDGSLGPAGLAALNARVAPADVEELDDTVVLAARRRRAAEVNARRLALLDDRERVFEGARSGDWPPWEATPVPEALALRRGARVMLARNDPDGAWVNGSLGTVTGFRGELVEVALDAGPRVRVGRATWERTRYALDERTGDLRTEVVGRYRQHPLMLAWAVTVHKAQGLTFDRVHLDLGAGAFAPGQAYVALSRCRTLDGVTLETPLRAADVRADPRVAAFWRGLADGRSGDGGPAAQNA